MEFPTKTITGPKFDQAHGGVGIGGLDTHRYMLLHCMATRNLAVGVQAFLDARADCSYTNVRVNDAYLSLLKDSYQGNAGLLL